MKIQSIQITFLIILFNKYVFMDDHISVRNHKALLRDDNVEAICIQYIKFKTRQLTVYDIDMCYKTFIILKMAGRSIYK